MQFASMRRHMHTSHQIHDDLKKMYKWIREHAIKVVTVVSAAEIIIPFMNYVGSLTFFFFVRADVCECT